MLTPKQEQKYWRTWAKILACQGWTHEPADRKNVRRKLTHINCGLKNEDGTGRSMKSFGNRDFSRWLAATAHLCDEVDIRDRDRENAVWRIRQDATAAGLDDAYLASIARDLYHASDWESLSIEQLEAFRNTIHNRAGSKVGHDTRNTAPAQPRRQYTLDGGKKNFNGAGGVIGNTPSRVHAAEIAGSIPAQPHPIQEVPMQTRQRKPATVMGPIPVAPPSASKYCMHAVPPPTSLPAAPPGGTGDMIASDINAHWKDPDEMFHAIDPSNEPF